MIINCLALMHKFHVNNHSDVVGRWGYLCHSWTTLVDTILPLQFPALLVPYVWGVASACYPERLHGISRSEYPLKISASIRRTRNRVVVGLSLTSLCGGRLVRYAYPYESWNAGCHGTNHTQHASESSVGSWSVTIPCTEQTSQHIDSLPALALSRFLSRILKK